MSNNRKFFLGIMGLLMTAGVADAQTVGAADDKDEAILFKIHDITPDKSKEKGVRSCDFYVTFYNRSEKDINGAQIVLNWIDSSLTDVVNDEKADSAERNRKGEPVDANFSYTQRGNPIDLSAKIDMPAIKSYKQITVRSSVETDRCFVLLNDLKADVLSCTAKNDTGNSGNMINGGGCNSLFRFVSANNPEYYMEFKRVSHDEQKNTERKQRASQEKEMENQYGKTVESFETLSKILSDIK